MHSPATASTSTIILLNGISSAGKTSISKVLQQTMNEPYLQVSIDAFEDMLPDRYKEEGPFAWQSLFPKLLTGFHSAGTGAVAALVGLLFIAISLAPERVFGGTSATHVHCSLEEAKRREQARSDQFTGTAERQFPRVHRHNLYDVEVDTTHTSPEACAEQIRTFVGRHAPTAFANLRQMPRQSIP